MMEAAFDLRRQASFDLDRPDVAAGKRQQQIDLGTGRRAIEIGQRALGRGGEQRFDDEAFPARTGDGMAQHVIDIGQAEQHVPKAAVAHVDARRSDQPLAGICVPGFEPADEQQIDQQVEPGRDRLAIDTQRGPVRPR